MASQNLFEKYGIKEVADVTFYRIDRVDETYESQRKITISSILKSAVEQKMVYPLVNENGTDVGAEEGFMAYVFNDAELKHNANYECDDDYKTIFVSPLSIQTKLLPISSYSILTKGTNPLIVADNGKYSKVDGVEDTTTFTMLFKDFCSIFFGGLVNDKTLLDGLKEITLTVKFTTQGGYISKINVGYDAGTAKTEIADVEGAGERIPVRYREGSDNYATVNVANANITGTVELQDADSAYLVFKDGDGKSFNVYSDEKCTSLLAQDATINGEKFRGYIRINTLDDLNSVLGSTTVLDYAITTALNDDITTKQKFLVNPVIIAFDIEESLAGDTYSITSTQDLSVDIALDKMVGKDGTHEYSYEEQLLMLFAQDQNLITKTGTRYQFRNAKSIFGNFSFSDNFATTPHSTDKVVVLVYGGHADEVTYNLDEINTEISKLTETITAKAYDVEYNLFAELMVEDEMGYFNNRFLGTTISGSVGNEKVVGNYRVEKATNLDVVLANAVMWDKDKHVSINDAIDALRAKKKVLDAGADSGLSGFARVHGGYKVTDTTLPKAGDRDEAGRYHYSFEDRGDSIKSDGYSLDIAQLKSTLSKYALIDVLDYLEAAAEIDGATGDDIAISVDEAASGQMVASNRAIYVDTDSAQVSARAYIYLLRNKNYKTLSKDTDGVFRFVDRCGNTCYYQDTIFAGTEYLALVIIGKNGLIFTVNRHGNKNISKVAWMVNENGYINNKVCDKIVKHGVIHTTSVTVDDETFDATCQLSKLAIKKIQKKVLKYTPVLFLDTLKVSTLEQTAEQTAATGGRGNAQLIIWDYGKEITLSLQDALYTPASMSAMFGSSKDKDFINGVKDTKKIDRTEKCTATRSFIVPAGNSKGVPSEGDQTAQAVYIDLNTMKPYEDGTPIAEGEIYLKWTRSVAYGDNSLGNTIEISADRFPGTYRVVGDTFTRNKTTGEDQRFQFIIQQAKMTSEQTITLEAEGDPTVNVHINSNAVVKVA